MAIGSAIVERIAIIGINMTGQELLLLSNCTHSKALKFDFSRYLTSPKIRKMHIYVSNSFEKWLFSFIFVKIYI